MENKKEQHNNFIISLSGINIDISIVNIEEMDGYCAQRGRLANVISEKKTYDGLDKLNYSLLMNYKNPKPRVVCTKNKPYMGVYHILSEKFKGGLLIIENDTISDTISEFLCKTDAWDKNDVDIMICKSFSSMTEDEMRRANILRISADPDFDPDFLLKNDGIFKEKTGVIMVSQYFVNDNYNSVAKHIEKRSAECEAEGMTEYIDYYELNKQLAYFIYLDLESGKILNVDRQVIIEFLQRMSKSTIPMPQDQIIPYSEMITLD